MTMMMLYPTWPSGDNLLLAHPAEVLLADQDLDPLPDARSLVEDLRRVVLAEVGGLAQEHDRDVFHLANHRCGASVREGLHARAVGPAWRPSHGLVQELEHVAALHAHAIHRLWLPGPGPEEEVAGDGLRHLAAEGYPVGVLLALRAALDHPALDPLLVV